MRTALIATALAGLVATGAAGQIGNPGFMAAGTKMAEPGKPAPNQTNNVDRLFARLVAAGGTAEVAFGELAADKAQGDAVKDFARTMVEDHSAANDELKALADAATIPLPQELDPDHARMRAELEQASGAQFDLTYIQGQIVDHQKTVQLLQWEIASGQDAELQRFAAETLPVVLHHLETAKAIQADLTGRTCRAGSASLVRPENRRAADDQGMAEIVPLAAT